AFMASAPQAMLAASLNPQTRHFNLAETRHLNLGLTRKLSLIRVMSNQTDYKHKPRGNFSSSLQNLQVDR
ncbi:hypothetical protein, partial [Burkholderia gladioli]|uniref:hypothetical protein n=1 Tax=Burkholderia gladioli TaxID=28095 RepID=UPI001ABB490E